MEFDGRRYLVAPRGETNWVRNVRAAGRPALRRGRRRQEFEVGEVAAEECPVLLKAYLDCFAIIVQRYFPVAKGSPASEFAPISDSYLVFDLRTPSYLHGAGAANV